MNQLDKINELLNSNLYDIRRYKEIRFSDQKCTPDVISFIASCVFNEISNNEEFTSRQIRESEYFATTVQEIFNKPAPTDSKTKREYDKFVLQPLNLLAYSKVLICEKRKNRNYYKINNRNILAYISANHINAFNFLNLYFEKVMIDSEFKTNFDHFFNEQDEMAYNTLKVNFGIFIKGNTNIRNTKEINRIFPKILNIFAVKKALLGSIEGKISKFPIYFTDLMYNRINFRDVEKSKNITRKESKEIEKKLEQFGDNSKKYNEYTLDKSKKLVRTYHDFSEVKDSASGKTVHVHHIFPKGAYPQIASYIENLIALTSKQHCEKAHPEGRTSEISLEYQMVCLQSKLETVKNAFHNNQIYDKNNFIYVLNIGFKYTGSMMLPPNLHYDDIKNEILKYYKIA